MWLLEESVFKRIEKAILTGAMPSADQIVEIEAASSRRNSSGGPEIMNIAGSNAEILVSGVLTKKPDWMARFFGGGNTTYSDIIESLVLADADPAIDNITMRFDSPGGSVSGLFDAADAIKRTSKNVTAIVDDLAASAAFGLASQADSIVASNKGAMVGSVGILARVAVSDNIVDITSSEAPDKKPDVTTDEGKRVVQKGLDAVHQLFAEIIADGRNTTVARVNKDFGRGGVVLAEDAVERGMIDSLMGSASRSLVSNNLESAKMDITKLKADHPSLYAQVIALGVVEGVDTGVAQERERVSAHVVMGQAYGATDVALEAIKDGSKLTQLHQANYMAAQANRNDVENRSNDSAESDPGTPTSVAPEESDASAVASEVERLMGVETEGGAS